MIPRGILALGSATLLAGCVELAPHYVRAPAPIAPTWPSGEAYAPSSVAVANPPAFTAIIADQNLQAIVTQALHANRDLRVAAAAVASARAQARLADAQRLPLVEASVASATTDGTGIGTRRSSAEVGVASFELDLFGRLRDLGTAAIDRYLASEAAARATRLALVTQIATAYVDLATDRSLLVLARASQANGRHALELTTARFAGGMASDLDVRQARTVLDQALSDEQNQLTLVAQDRNALELLTGSAVADALLPQSIETVEGRIGVTPTGISSEVLLVRPDVIEAETLLKADHARIGAARAAFFPRISLTGVFGLASPALSGLLHGGSFGLGAGGAAGLPIFDGGANAAVLADIRAQRDASLAHYEHVVQIAFREVADALARQGTIDAQTAAQVQLVADARATLDLNTARYRAGIDSFLDTLVSERAFYTASKSLVATRRLRAANRIALTSALGGTLE